MKGTNTKRFGDAAVDNEIDGRIQHHKKIVQQKQDVELKRNMMPEIYEL